MVNWEILLKPADEKTVSILATLDMPPRTIKIEATFPFEDLLKILDSASEPIKKILQHIQKQREETKEEEEPTADELGAVKVG